MEIGSIVVMVQPLTDFAKKYLVARGFTKWPVPSDTVYHMITDMRDMQDTKAQFKVGIQIDTYPDITAAGLYFNAEKFAELLPPGDISISETEESAQPKVKELELELV